MFPFQSVLVVDPAPRKTALILNLPLRAVAPTRVHAASRFVNAVRIFAKFAWISTIFKFRVRLLPPIALDFNLMVNWVERVKKYRNPEDV